MRASFTLHFQRSYQKLSREIQDAFDKQAKHLFRDMRYPSLRVKKFDEKRNIWQLRVTGSYRAYFEIQEGVFLFHEIKTHSD